MDGKTIIHAWLQEFSASANSGDLDKHLAMVSNQLLVFGVSKKGFLDYTEWMKRRRNDLKQGRLLRINYRNISHQPAQANRLVFDVEETLKNTTGESFVIAKTMTLIQEDDRWLLTDERIRNINSQVAPGLQSARQPS